MAALVAKNATTQRQGNVQKMHIALKRQDHGQGWWPEHGGQMMQKMQQFRWFVRQGTVFGKEIVGC
jgi:hypothetical protein